MAKEQRNVVLFALSTCIWCRKTKAWLEEKGIQYTLFHMDLLTGPEKEAAMTELKRHTDRVAYPIIVLDEGAKVIQGFHPDQFEEELG